ncbi:MAG: DUF350 domain-containing protein [Nitrospirae bacterium]|nr:MAG: DUF350 domain-containing protein [Nitrospirota bacterium]
MENLIHLKDVVSSIIFSFFGLALFGLAFYIFDKITPGDLSCEILEKQNVAAAIVIAAMIIGLSLIIAMSIHG